METLETTIFLDNGEEADVTVSFYFKQGEPASYDRGESQMMQPADPDEIEIISVVTCDGVDVTNECDLDRVEELAVASMY